MHISIKLVWEVNSDAIYPQVKFINKVLVNVKVNKVIVNVKVTK